MTDFKGRHFEREMILQSGQWYLAYSLSYRGYRFPPEIISHAVWLYHRSTLSLRDIEDLLAERGIIVSYESIRRWCTAFGLDFARVIRKRQGRLGDTWHMDEFFITINGQRHYL